MLLRECLHTHKTCSCGKMTPQAVSDAHQEWGCDFIDFTIHHGLLSKPYDKDLFSGVKADMTVISGIELTVFARGYLPECRISEENDNLNILNHPRQYGLMMDQIFDMNFYIIKANPLQRRFM